ncbi:DUF4349 domain-containing protein [Glycomyces buryatensis]|nr:DUF4349 domain-containing protein [Glycomyces buryatensis]
MRLLSIPAAFLAALVLMAGCSESGGEDGGVAAQGLGQMEAEDNAAPEEEQQPLDVAEQRDLIYTASVETVDPDPIRVAEGVWAAAESYDGFVTSDAREGADDWTRVELVVRIPSAQFQEAMDELVALAHEEVTRTVNTEDVTGQAVDLEAAIATKSASLERVRALLDDAESIQSILDLESELAEREAEVASLEAQLEGLQDSVDYSTITFIASTPEPEEEEAGYGGPGNFLEGLGSGLSGLLTFLVALSIALGVVLPFALLAGVVLVVIWRVRRARRARRPQEAESVQAPE